MSAEDTGEWSASRTVENAANADTTPSLVPSVRGFGRALLASEGGMSLDDAREELGVGTAGAHAVRGVTMVASAVVETAEGVPAIGHLGYAAVLAIRQRAGGEEQPDA